MATASYDWRSPPALFNREMIIRVHTKYTGCHTALFLNLGVFYCMYIYSIFSTVRNLGHLIRPWIYFPLMK